MDETPELLLNRGSDLNFDLEVPDGPAEDAPPLDLSGYTVEVFEPHQHLAGHLTLTISDALSGRIQGRLVWSDTMESGRAMTFRVRLLGPEGRMSTPKIVVVVR